MKLKFTPKFKIGDRLNHSRLSADVVVVGYYEVGYELRSIEEVDGYPPFRFHHSLTHSYVKIKNGLEKAIEKAKEYEEEV